MFRPMRRWKQQLSDEDCIAILKNEPRGILSVLGDDGYPYGIPMNHWYCEADGKLYFHGAKTGHKIDLQPGAGNGAVYRKRTGTARQRRFSLGGCAEGVAGTAAGTLLLYRRDGACVCAGAGGRRGRSHRVHESGASL